MKLVQLNIWQGRLLRQAIDLLEDEQPDIICLQEVHSCEQDTSPLFEFFEFLQSLEAIQAKFPGYHTFFAPTYDMTILGSKILYGNAVLSRYPIVNQDTFFISGEYRSYQTLEDFELNTRSLQRAIIQLDDGRSLCLLNHHGYWASNPLGSETTVGKMQAVADIIASSPSPLIFAGDLNITPDSPAMQPVHKLLRNLTQENRVATTLSPIRKLPDVACDHICISEGIDVQNFVVSERVVSDHKALILEFSLTA